MSALIDLYTGLKAAFPQLRTAATIGWGVNISQMQLPLDLWVDHYVDFFQDDWRAHDRLNWLAQGKEYMWYWSDDPWDVRKLNPSWIEWPVIHGRLLFWLASLHGVPGMLYWVTDLWAGACHGNTTTPSCDLLSCAEPRASGWSYVPLNHSSTQGESKRMMLKHNGECVGVDGCSSCDCHTKTAVGAKLVMGKCCTGAGVPAYIVNCTYWLKPAHYDGKHRPDAAICWVWALHHRSCRWQYRAATLRRGGDRDKSATVAARAWWKAAQRASSISRTVTAAELLSRERVSHSYWWQMQPSA